MNSASDSSKSHSFLIFVFALLSFFPSDGYLLLLNVAVIIVFFRVLGFKYVILFAGVSIFTFAGAILQSHLYVKGYILAFLNFSSLIYIFYAREVQDQELTSLTRFARFYVLLSLLQIPIQIFQFMRVYGLDLAQFITNSSAGDEALGTIGNSALLADKQLLALFMLWYFRKEYSRSWWFFMFIALSLSFLVIGANHTILALLFAALVFVTTTLFQFQSIKLLTQKVGVVALLFVSIYGVLRFLLESQYQYISDTLGHVANSLEYAGKIRAYLGAYEVFTRHTGLLITGLGLGTFASRAAFMLSGEYLWQGKLALFGVERSVFFEQQMFPLWNRQITDIQYLAGTVNQPFSTYLAVLSECGIIVFAVFLIYCGRVLWYFHRHDAFMYFLVLFLMTMLFIDNFLEFPRFIAPFLFFVFSLYKNHSYYASRRETLT